MSFTLFRICILVWNSLPSALRSFLSWTRIPHCIDQVWFPYRDLPVPDSEIEVQTVINGLVKPGWTCADVGANYGMMTEMMALATGKTGKVFAFEAHPLNAHILRRRVEAKGFAPFTTVENVAVSDGTESSITLYPGRRHSPNEWNILGHDISGKPTKGAFVIPAIKLDDYFAQAKRLDFVKIDVEGAEVKVIPGMKKLLHEKKPILVVEFHSAEAWKARSFLLEANYRLLAIEDGKDISNSSEKSSVHVVACPPGVEMPQGIFLGRHK